MLIWMIKIKSHKDLIHIFESLLTWYGVFIGIHPDFSEIIINERFQVNFTGISPRSHWDPHPDFSEIPVKSQWNQVWHIEGDFTGISLFFSEISLRSQWNSLGFEKKTEIWQSHWISLGFHWDLSHIFTGVEKGASQMSLTR